MSETDTYSGPQVEMPLDHLLRVRKSVSEYGYPNYNLSKKYSQILIAGMGGSGISGALVSDVCGHYSNIPICVLSDCSLPRWVDEKTLLMIVSYSGNTWEMINLYKEAKKRNCALMVVTAGGKLKTMAENDGSCLYTFSGGYMPRSDIGFVIMYMIAILKDNDSNLKFRGVFRTALDKAIDYARQLADENDSDNEAMSVAKDVLGRVPFIYSTGALKSVSGRWKTQFNENSKIVAASALFPEFNHNSLEGWGNNQCEEIIPILLRSDDEGDIATLMDTCNEVLSETGNGFRMVHIPGENLIERVMNGFVLGDYTSIYLAKLRGVDPSPVEYITEYKNRLNKRI